METLKPWSDYRRSLWHLKTEGFSAEEISTIQPILNAACWEMEHLLAIATEQLNTSNNLLIEHCCTTYWPDSSMGQYITETQLLLSNIRKQLDDRRENL